MSIKINVNKLKKYFTLFILLVIISPASAYIHNQTRSGTHVHWPSSSSTIDLYVNSQNSQGMTESLVQSIAASSIAEWNGVSRITLRKNSTLSKGQDDFNEVYFTNDPAIFSGSGVIGVTQVGFKDETGEIVDADILINENFYFATDPLDSTYLGNVITHEVGHFLGLGHGQVSGSSMFYALSRGQHKVSDDDKAGVFAIYPNGDTTKGTLSGTIVGGSKLINIFGAHVQAISVKTGKVMGAAISEANGKFSIAGLNQDDQYLIYTNPIKQLGLPTNYTGVRSDFCESSKKYRGSFFQSCGASAEGFPQAVRLSTSSIDVGNITIRCGLDTPPEYFQNKNITPAEFDLNSYSTSGLGGSFVGFFSAAEVLQGSVNDYFKLDLRNVDWATVSSSNSLYLEVKISNQPFYSAFKAQVNIKRPSGSYDVTPDYTQASDGWLNIDTIERVSINRGISSDNTFEIKVTPETMEYPHFPAGIPYTKDDLFPSSSDLQDNLYFYLVTATIVKDNGDGSFTQVSSRNDTLSDNSQCPDASNTYALSNYTVKGISSTSNRKQVAGCGTVDMDGSSGGGGGGPGGFMVGLMLSFIISYALSRYSKLV